MSFYKHGEVLISNIKEFNKYFGFQMPEDYIRFLFFTNGGRFDFEDEHSIILDEVGIEIWPDVLYGNTTSYRGNLIFWNDMYRDEIPENALIIGDTQNHGFLVYVCSGDNKGVYYWDDCLSIEGSSDKRNAYLIAGTFDEFFFKTQITREEFYNENGTSDIELRIGEIIYYTVHPTAKICRLLMRKYIKNLRIVLIILQYAIKTKHLTEKFLKTYLWICMQIWWLYVWIMLVIKQTKSIFMLLLREESLQLIIFMK